MIKALAILALIISGVIFAGYLIVQNIDWYNRTKIYTGTFEVDSVKVDIPISWNAAINPRSTTTITTLSGTTLIFWDDLTDTIQAGTVYYLEYNSMSIWGIERRLLINYEEVTK